MLSRRAVLGTAAGFALAPSAFGDDLAKKKLATITTERRYRTRQPAAESEFCRHEGRT